RAAARFIGRVRRRLVEALADKPDIKRTQIADALGVHRSVITRQLKGTQDLTLGRVAEIAWALGLEPMFDLRDAAREDGCNVALPPPPAQKFSATVQVQIANAATFKADQASTKVLEVL